MGRNGFNTQNNENSFCCINDIRDNKYNNFIFRFSTFVLTLGNWIKR